MKIRALHLTNVRRFAGHTARIEGIGANPYDALLVGGRTYLVGLFGESRVQGFELALAGELARNWNVNLGYTYLDGEVTQSSEFGPAGTRLE